MLPYFRFRWQPKADQRLAQPETQVAEQAIDLATTTPDDFPRFLGPRRIPSLDDLVAGSRSGLDGDASAPAVEAADRWRLVGIQRGQWICGDAGAAWRGRIGDVL